MADKHTIDEWALHLKTIMDATSINVNETEEERTARKAALEGNPENWFAYYFPQYAYAEPAGFHIEATQRILARKELYEIRMWSRELAKSTRTMMEVMYLALVGHMPAEGDGIRLKKKCILLISNSLDNATRLLMPYKANLQCNERIIQDYGRQENAGKWQAAEFTTEGGISFRALGAGQSPRGTRNEEARPDILLFDDVDTDADCLNPEIVAKKWRWIEEAAIGTRSVSQPTTIVFCGNRIAVDCCIHRATSFADVTTIINIRDAQGVSSWPHKNTEADIDRVLSQKSYAAAQKEYYNNPIVEGSVFRQMAYKPPYPLADYQALLCYTDPSFSDTGDYKATVLVGKHGKEYHVLKCYLQQTGTSSMVDWHFEILEATMGYRCQFYMEKVFMQDVIIKQVNDACVERGINLFVQEDARGKPNKFTRIEAMLEPLNRTGRLFLSEAERYSPHMQRLEEQFLALAFGSSAHDDGPDAVEGAIWLLGERWDCKRSLKDIIGGKPRRDNAMVRKGHKQM